LATALAEKGQTTPGLWTLFHVSTIGVAERHDDVLGLVAVEKRRQERRRQKLQWWQWSWRRRKTTKRIDNDDDDGESGNERKGGGRVSTSHAARVIRDYVDFFFGGCEICRLNFVTMYDSCGFNVCQRMSADALHEANEIDGRESWRELAIWLWEVHNDINIQKGISATKNGNEMSMEKFVNTNDFIWPSQGECPECRRVDNDSVDGSGDILWDIDAVYNHLKKVYWPSSEGGAIHIPHITVLSKWKRLSFKSKREGSGSTGIGLFLVYIFLLVGFGSLILWLNQPHRQFRWGSFVIWDGDRHKKKKRKKKKKEESYHTQDEFRSFSVPSSTISNRFITQRGRRNGGGRGPGRRARHTFVYA